LSTLSRDADVQLFRFRIDGLDTNLAIPAEWTLGVARLPFVTRIPFAPPAIRGLSRWQETPVSIVDLRMLLQEDVSASRGKATGGHHLIVRTLGARGGGLVGWPIMAGADTVRVAAQMAVAAMPEGIRAGTIHAAVTIGDEAVLLLNPLGLFAVAA
jgi:chemotaxis signal transduction protein